MNPIPGQKPVAEELEALEILIEATDSNVLVFALYSSVLERESGVRLLREALTIPVVEYTLNDDLSDKKNDPVFLLLNTATDRTCICFREIENLLPQIALYLNMHRETFAEVPHVVIFWVREQGLKDFARLMPDLWSWRSGVYDFRTKEFDERQIWALQEIFGSDVPDREEGERKVRLYESLLQQYEQDGDRPFQARLENNLGEVFIRLGKFEEAEKHLQRAVAVQEEVLGAQHPDTATTYNSLGSLYSNTGDLEKAEEYYKKALYVREQAVGKYDPQTAGIYNNLGRVYTSKGDLKQAEEYYQKALDIALQTEDRHVLAAIVYNNLGVVYAQRRNLEQAEEYYKKALATREKIYGVRHPETFMIYNNLGGVYSERGDWEQAEEYYRKALVLQEELFGGVHPDTALLYSNIGVLYERKGQYSQADEALLKALEIYRILGIASLEAKTLSNLGSVYYDKGELDQAEKYYQKALTIRLSLPGINPLDVARSHNALGVLYSKKGEWEKVEQHYEQALAVLDKAGINQHPLKEKIRENLSNTRSYRTLSGAHLVADEASKYSGKIGRNDPCYCGSGKKYKHCHGA